MPDHRHALIIIIIMGAATLATRILPVLIFGRNEKIPDLVLYLGRVVPFTAMGLLIVYCLKDVSVLQDPHALPEVIALAAVTVTYLWKKNPIFSVVMGTVLYMFLVQKVF